MANTKAKRHIHKYYRGTLGFTRVWVCALPECNHYMPKNMESMINGKASICWECGEYMVLTPGNMDMDRPVCNECTLGKDLAEKVSNIGNDTFEYKPLLPKVLAELQANKETKE